MKEVIFFSKNSLLLTRWHEAIAPARTVTSIEALAKMPSEHTVLLFDWDTMGDVADAFFDFMENHPHFLVLVLTGTPSFEQGSALLKQGIFGYGNSYMHPHNLKVAVEVVETKQVWLYPEFMQKLIASIGVPASATRLQPQWELLTGKEQEVAKWTAQGMTNKEIASKLDITERTVKAHLGSIYTKWHISDRLSLALKVKSLL